MSANPYQRQPVAIAADNADHPRVQAERILLGAMLRDVALMPQIIGGLNTVALSNAANGLGAAFLEIIAQFKEHGKYTVASVARGLKGSKVKFDPTMPGTLISESLPGSLAFIASEETETDLPMALDWWWLQYQNWAQLQAYSAAQGFGATMAMDALAMRENVAKAEKELGLNWTPSTNTAPEDFQQWGVDKIEGKLPVSNMRSRILSTREYMDFYARGEVTILSGDTSMGKSQLALNLFSDFTDLGAKGIFNSLEMPPIDIYKRLLGIRHGINPKANWQEKDYPRIVKALEEVKALPNPVEALFTMSEIEAACYGMKYAGGIDFLFVDLLKDVATATYPKMDMNPALSLIMPVFKRLARKADIHVFLLHHINGEIAKRSNKRPNQDDLRDTKAIKQDSANIIFCYRPVYYGITEDERGNSLLIRDDNGNTIGDRAEIIFSKQRNGILGSAQVQWSPIRGYRDLKDYTPPQTAPF